MIHTPASENSDYYFWRSAKRFYALLAILFLTHQSAAFAQSQELDRQSWTLSASTGRATQNAVDDDIFSRWTTFTEQQPGQSFTVDLSELVALDTLTMVTRSPSQSELDFPRGYEVTLSADGQNFGPVVASGTGSTSGTTEISFGAQQAQFIKITQTGSDSFYWWSIHDLRISGTPVDPTDPVNQAPQLSFVAPTPANNSSVDVDAVLAIEVDATDSDGEVESVSLFVDDQLVGEREASPYAWSSDTEAALSDLTPGRHEFKAEARDNLGAITSIILELLLTDDNDPGDDPTDPPGNVAPTGIFIPPTPANGAELTSDEVIFVQVQASDSDGSISNVRLHIDGQFVRQENVDPYEWNSNRDRALANLAVGEHILRADIADNDGSTRQVSTSITIVAGDPDDEEPNSAPSVQFISPTPGIGTPLPSEGDDINVAANASDTDDNLETVSLFLNDNLVASLTQAPFEWSAASFSQLSGLGVGSYTLRVVAEDEDGATNQQSRSFTISDDDDDDPDLASCTVSGDLQQWHRVELVCDGPFGDESNEATFTNNRFNVTFSNGSESLVVPGHFAADGNAGNTSASSGNKWRAYFSPPTTGNWNYQVSFRTGNNIAVSLNPNAGTPTGALNGVSGSFDITGSGAVTRDMRTRGLLEHRSGETRLRFAGTGDVFVQGGVDSPENLFGYDEIDNTIKFNNRGSCKGILHSFDPHEQDWNPGDPVWGNGRGRSLIGLINYIADTGANSFYIMMNTVNGDGCDAHPWTEYNSSGDVKSFDVSKLDQWEVALSHMTSKGLLIHAMTQETENDGLLNNRNLGLERQLYYRELISRFGHHPALLWNMGEENNSSTSQLEDYAEYLKAVDPYDHPVHVHNKPNDRESKFSPLLGEENFDGPTIQISNINDSGDMYDEIRNWISRSTNAGNPWVVTLTEASGGGSANLNNDISSTQRLYWMWASVMSGGGGFEWYLNGRLNGTNHALDLAIEDLRDFDSFWIQSGHLVRFFRDIVQRDANIDLQDLDVLNNAVNGNDDWVIGNPGQAYIVVLREGGSANLNLAQGSNYEMSWFNPRSGQLIDGGVVAANGNTGSPPSQTNQDWVMLLTATSASVPIIERHPDIVRVEDRPLNEILQVPGGASWADSYSVGDQCYCSTSFDHNIGPVEVDTPVGRITVREACDLIGPGPGRGDRPLYNDVQCGNGPPNDAGDEDWCPGRVDVQGTNDQRKQGCNHIGPTWKF